jgi:hypothetical protein
MQPIDERKEYNLTSSQNEKVKNDIETLIRSFDDLQDRKFEFYRNDLTVIKPRKKNTHLIPKKKKRKK